MNPGSPVQDEGSARIRLQSWLEGNAVRICQGLIALVLLGGFAYSLQLGDRLRYPDERDFLHIADSVCANGLYSRDGGATPTAYRAPGYPLLLAGLRCAGAPILVLRMFGFACLAGAAWFAGRAASRHRGRVAQVLVTAGVLFYPLHVYTAATLYPQALAMLGFAILLDRVAATHAQREFTSRSAVAVAVTATVLILSVPPMLPAFGICALGIAVGADRGRARLLLVGVAIALGVTSWTARNASVMGEPIPFSTNSGYNLALGNSPNTLPSSGLSVDIEVVRKAARGKPEAERDRAFRDAALDWIRSEPAAAAKLYAGKFAYFFAASNQIVTAGERNLGRDLLMYATYGPAAVLSLLVLALAAARRRRLAAAEVAAVLSLLATAAFYAVFFSRLRFRVPVEPAFLLLAGGFLADWLSRGGARHASAD